MEKGTPIPVVITTYQDRSFTFEMKTPPVSYFIKKAAKLESGSKTPGRDMAGYDYQGAGARDRPAEDEGPELPTIIDSAMRMVEGSARSMGIEVSGVSAMAKLGKRTEKVREGVDRTKLYPIDEAVKMIKDRAKAKFDETIEVAMNLGVDPRHADQMVRGVV